MPSCRSSASPGELLDICFVALQNRQEHRFRLAVGSFIEEYQNRIEIITCASPAAHPT